MNRPVVRIVRGVCSGFCFLVYGVFGLLALPVLLPLAGSRRAVRFLVRCYYRLFVGLMSALRLIRIEAPAGLRTFRGRIVAMNHLSLIDIVVLMSLLPDSTCIVKAEAARNPFLLAAVRTMFLVNGGDAERTVDEADRLLRAGVNLIVFPEGTRIPKACPDHPLHRGAARLSLATGVPIETLHLEVDPPVLAKKQPFWDVADRIIRYNIRLKGPLFPVGACDRRTAAALTDRIKERIL